MRYSPSDALLPESLLQLRKYPRQRGGLHVVNLEGGTDAIDQGDRELASEMLPEFLEAFQDRKTIRAFLRELRSEEMEPERFDQAKNPFTVGVVEPS